MVGVRYEWWFAKGEGTSVVGWSCWEYLEKMKELVISAWPVERISKPLGSKFWELRLPLPAVALKVCLNDCHCHCLRMPGCRKASRDVY